MNEEYWHKFWIQFWIKYFCIIFMSTINTKWDSLSWAHPLWLIIILFLFNALLMHSLLALRVIIRFIIYTNCWIIVLINLLRSRRTKRFNRISLSNKFAIILLDCWIWLYLILTLYEIIIIIIIVFCQVCRY